MKKRKWLDEILDKSNASYTMNKIVRKTIDDVEKSLNVDLEDLSQSQHLLCVALIMRAANLTCAEVISVASSRNLDLSDPMYN
jgi:hypothetical protein